MDDVGPDTVSLPPKEMEVPFSILDTDLYKVCRMTLQWMSVLTVTDAALMTVHHAICRFQAVPRRSGCHTLYESVARDAIQSEDLRLDPGARQSCVLVSSHD